MAAKKEKEDNFSLPDPAETISQSDQQVTRQVVQRTEFLRRRRRKNLLVGLALAPFCVTVFAWVVVRMGGL